MPRLTDKSKECICFICDKVIEGSKLQFSINKEKNTLHGVGFTLQKEREPPALVDHYSHPKCIVKFIDDKKNENEIKAFNRLRTECLTLTLSAGFGHNETRNIDKLSIDQLNELKGVLSRKIVRISKGEDD